MVRTKFPVSIRDTSAMPVVGSKAGIQLWGIEKGDMEIT